MRLVAIESGDCEHSWTDIVKVSDDLNLKDAKRRYDKWYRQEYCVANKPSKFYAFHEWLIEFCGGAKPDEQDIEYFNEDTYMDMDDD